MLPEVINKMSLKNSANEFRQFINDVYQYLEKDKNLENITDKLMRRLKEEIGEEEIKNVTYTLSILNIRELSLRKILEGFS
jgi:hypothetical protein